MYGVSRELIVTLITVWWLESQGKIGSKKTSSLEVRNQYQIEITNRFAALKNLSDEEERNRAWENIKENVKASVKESLGLH
jgi:hypothetical protein